jgi:FkbM family methyltransferase
MMEALGWMFPDGETHLIAWMSNPKNKLVMNGRQSYQGAKQAAVMPWLLHRRRAVDVGAHVGLWSFNLAHVFDRVEAVEPVAAHRECFAVNCSGVADKITMHPVALGARTGSVGMVVAPGSSGDSRVGGDGAVPMITLDSLDLKDVDLIKIDCEGYEENVIAGAVETIKRCRPVIVVEQKRDMATRFGLKPKGAVSALEAMGYRVAKEIGGDYIMVRQ